MKTIAILIFVVFSALYIGTMCPTVYTMDNGELIVAAERLTIAHPTGYPLFCLLGKLATCVIPFGTVAWQINAMNALIAAAAVAVLFLALSEVARKEIAAFGAMLFAVSPIFWQAATSAEVHALTALLISIELLLFLRWRRTGDNRLLCCLALAAGLSLTNHLASAVVLPGLLYSGLRHDRSILRNRGLVARSFVLLLLPLALYLYLPVRAAASTGTIWGDIYAATGFIAHVTARAFRNRMFSSPPAAVWGNFLTFLNLVIAQFPIYLAWALPVGALLARRRHSGLMAAIGIVMIVNVLYAVNYAIPDIEPYYIPTMLALSVLFVIGLESAIEAVQRRLAVHPSRYHFHPSRYHTWRDRLLPPAIAWIALPAILVLVVIAGFPRADKRHARFIMDYAENVLASLPENALFIACGDSSYSAMLYARVVNGQRPDLIVVERNIARRWMPGADQWTARCYYDSVSERSPAMRKFRWPSDYTRRQIKGEKFLADVIAAALPERPVYMGCIGNEYSTHPIARHLARGHRLVPVGAVYRVLPAGQRIDTARLVEANERLWKSYELRGIYDGSIQGGELERDIPDRYAASHVALADLELKAGLHGLAAANYSKALAIDPNLLRARKGLAVALTCQGDFRRAAKEWRTVLVYKPDDESALQGLGMARAMLRGSSD